jgi:hypothetical protein
MDVRDATRWTRAAVALTVVMVGPSISEGSPILPDEPEAVLAAARQEKRREIAADKAGYAAALVTRWEPAAREAGRWDASYAADLLASLVRLDPESLLAAGEASSYPAFLRVLAAGPNSLGQNFQDLVYTPIAPCRIVDTRRAAEGALAAGVARTFEVDSGNLLGQGGSPVGCGIPLAVAQAVEMTIIAVEPAGPGYLTAWGLGAQPATSVLNYAGGDVVADTAIVPVVPGGGPDFSLSSRATTHVVVDVLGYFAAANATALDCINVTSGSVLVPPEQPTNIDVTCPAGRTATAGGQVVNEIPFGFPGLFLNSHPIGLDGWRTAVENHTGGTRDIIGFAKCCRVPGR